MIYALLAKLAQLVEIEFADVVMGYDIIEEKLKINLERIKTVSHPHEHQMIKI